MLQLLLLAGACAAVPTERDDLLCSSSGTVSTRWLRDVYTAPPPGPHHGPQPTNPNCTLELKTACPFKPGHDGSGGDDVLGCLECTILHKKEAEACAKGDTTKYCMARYLEVHKLGASCGTALLDLMGDLAKDAQNTDDPTYAVPAEAVAAWGKHTDDPGQYYACNAIPGYSYWKVAWMSDPSGKNSSHGHGGGGGPPGGHGRRLQHHHHYHGGGCYGKKEMGICLPDECAVQQDVMAFSDSFIGIFHSLVAVCATKPAAPPFAGGASWMVGFICALVVLCVAGSIKGSTAWSACAAAMPLPENVEARAAKLVKQHFPSREAEVASMTTLEKWQFVQAVELAGPALTDSLTASSAADGLSQPLLPSTAASKPGAGDTADGGFGDWIEKILACFDCGANWSDLLFKVDGGIPEMRVLNGIRVLSMGWIVLGHTYQNMSEGVKNEGYALAVERRLISQLIPNGQNAVDSFFFLSGFLGSYVSLRKLAAEDRKGRTPSAMGFAGMFYLERYLRLTPIYLFVLLFYIHVMPHLESGPDSGGGGYDGETCRKYMWTNLLYVSNFYPDQFGAHAEGNLGCMDWSWYLSVDFQLHLLTPWLLTLFRKERKLLYVLVALLIGLSWTYNGFMVHYFDGGVCGEEGYFSQFSYNPVTHEYSEGNNLMTLEYDKPWTRCGPFLVGVALACYAAANRLPSGYLPPPGMTKILSGYVFWGFVMLICVFAPYWALPPSDALPPCNAGPESPSSCCQWSEWWDVIYTGTRVTFWGSAVGWIVYASLCAQGGPLTAFLCWNFWTPLARLTFAWYLMHPMWMDVLYGSSQAGILYYDLLGVTYYVSNCVIGLLCAFCVFFLVEAPALKLKILLMPQLFKFMRNLARASGAFGPRTPRSPRPDPRMSQGSVQAAAAN